MTFNCGNCGPDALLYRGMCIRCGMEYQQRSDTPRCGELGQAFWATRLTGKCGEGLTKLATRLADKKIRDAQV